MSDILDELSRSARERVNSGYYEVNCGPREVESIIPFTEVITGGNHAPIIGEIKPGSPTRGRILAEGFDPAELGRSYSAGGISGFSVLTDPDHFFGSLGNLARVSELNRPTLMKDFIVDCSQLNAGRKFGADAVLLIYRLFTREATSFGLNEGIDYAHGLGLEVLLETNDISEYESAMKTDAEMIGINNRDLRTLDVDLSRTERILGEAGKDRIVWSMSGISKRKDIEYLAGAGADAFLVGTSLTRSDGPERLLRELRGV